MGGHGVAGATRYGHITLGVRMIWWPTIVVIGIVAGLAADLKTQQVRAGQACHFRDRDQAELSPAPRRAGLLLL